MSDKCPKCGRTETVHRSDDGRMCLACGHKWSAETEQLRRQLAAEKDERRRDASAHAIVMRELNALANAAQDQLAAAEAACAAISLEVIQIIFGAPDLATMRDSLHYATERWKRTSPGQVLLNELERLRLVPKFIREYGGSLLDDLKLVARADKCSDISLAAIDSLAELLRQTERVCQDPDAAAAEENEHV